MCVITVCFTYICKGLVGDTQIAEIDDWVYASNRRTDTVEVQPLTSIEEEVLIDAVRF